MVKKHVGYFFRGRSAVARDAPDAFDVALMALQADRLEGGFLGIEVVVKARLPHAEEVGDVLRRGAVIATLREDLGGGVDDLRKSLPHAR